MFENLLSPNEMAQRMDTSTTNVTGGRRRREEYETVGPEPFRPQERRINPISVAQEKRGRFIGSGVGGLNYLVTEPEEPIRYARDAKGRTVRITPKRGMLSEEELIAKLNAYRTQKGKRTNWTFWVQKNFGDRFWSGKMTKAKKYKDADGVTRFTTPQPVYRISSSAKALLRNGAMRDKWLYAFDSVLPPNAGSITDKDVTNAVVYQQRRVDRNRAANGAHLAGRRGVRKIRRFKDGTVKRPNIKPERTKLY